MPHLFSHHTHEEGGAVSTASHHHHIASSHGSGQHRDHTPQSHHSVPTAPNATANADGSASENPENPLHPPHYRDALPSRLEAKFHGQPVTGTAIIVDELPDFMRNESEYELVTPQRTVVLETFAEVTMNANEMPSSSELLSNDSGVTPSAQSGDGEATTYSSHGRASVVSADRHKHKKHKQTKAEKAAEEKRQKQLEQHPHQVLKDGGYIIFSDKFLREHPDCKAATATLKYAGANPAPQSQPEIDPALSDEKKNTEKAKFLIEQSEGDYRPLFRKRDSDLVYGRAAYEPSETSGTDTNTTRSCDATPVPRGAR